MEEEIMRFIRNKSLIACSIALWAGLSAPLARADSLILCLQRCNNLAECDPAGGGANCSSAQHLCESGCRLQSGSGGGAVSADRYGVIVYDKPTGVYGTAWDWASAEEATRAAYRNCRKLGGSRCEWKIDVVNGCAAIASGSDGELFGKRSDGGASAIGEVASGAFSMCAVQGVRDCAVRAKICSNGEP
jgi:hypothetical protein